MQDEAYKSNGGKLTLVHLHKVEVKQLFTDVLCAKHHLEVMFCKSDKVAKSPRVHTRTCAPHHCKAEDCETVRGRD